ncbi:gibberellin-regulated protein 11-like [Dioscorea cayenensis subsp. rotundata]|uniref:Gibberellin-regulated protein 11-like n=1 Tax=Dioscorea cayennensis subsp. rotundata TaxID=55577 RepID=A0AB40BJ25_DIOCR|nr:gibberellin-regulated protein 11-like [Dioscorea cayenensis subsp. rotundata]
MASSQSLALSFLLVLLLAFSLVESQMEISGGIGRSLLIAKPTLDCGGACKVRCSKSSRPNLCKRACRTCCMRCHCVPPGTYGNYAFCPCYATLTTHGGKRKCP